jgi:Ni/Fe-hydrogenase subunit HybB-like protein
VTERNRWLKDILWLLVLGGAVAMVFRLYYGLGATTNLSDALPWGLWKILNMVAGVALSTGGFTLGFLVYGLRLERFRSLLKPAILIAFLGYGSSVFALILDIGLPYRIWHPLVMWNERSFLFEVAWCVMLYFTVTIMELSPTFLERLRLQGLAGLLHRVSPGIVVVGIALSSLHHSSLGSLFLVTPQRLHPLWYTSLIPVHFIVSAACSGMMVVVLAWLLFTRWYGKRAGLEQNGGFATVRRLACIAASLLGLYLALRLFDLVRTGAWRHLLEGTWESWLYLVEIVVAAVIPSVLMAVPAVRRSRAGLATAASFSVAGLVLNRLDVGIFGYFRDAAAAYVPSAGEWAVSLGVLAAAGLIFLWVVENYPIFDDAWRIRRKTRGRFQSTFDRASLVWQAAFGSGISRATMAAVVAVPLAWATLYPPFHAGGGEPPRPVAPQVAEDAVRTVLLLDGDRDGLAVSFPHLKHQQWYGSGDSCIACHHLSIPRDHSTPCSRCHRDMERTTGIFNHSGHFLAVASRENLDGPVPANLSCTVCHPQGAPKSARDVKTCLECHHTDMRPVLGNQEPLHAGLAAGYRVAMHDTCIPCHRKERDRVQRPDLAECFHCHQDRFAHSEHQKIGSSSL